MPQPARAVLLAALLGLAVAACGSSNSTGADDAGRRTQAIEELRGAGLTRAQADCTADALGADMVVEAPSMSALADSQAYQDAVKGCIDGR